MGHPRDSYLIVAILLLLTILAASTPAEAFGRRRGFGGAPFSDWNTRHDYETSDGRAVSLQYAILQWSLDHDTFPGDHRTFIGTSNTNVGTMIACTATGAAVAVDGPSAGEHGDMSAMNNGDVSANCVSGDGTTFSVTKDGRFTSNPPSNDSKGGKRSGHK